MDRLTDAASRPAGGGRGVADRRLPTYDSREIRNLLGLFPTGVAVITAQSDGEPPVGMTINSFASVSLDPALVLWSLSKRSASLRAVEDAGAFAIHFLGDSDRQIAERFASRCEDRFAGLNYTTGVTGAPLLESCMARIECQTTSVVDGGDHKIFIGAIVNMTESAKGRAPLVFHRGQFTQLQ